MQYKKCPKCRGTMIGIKDQPSFYRCSQCNYEAKTKEEIEKLEMYKTAQ